MIENLFRSTVLALLLFDQSAIWGRADETTPISKESCPQQITKALAKEIVTRGQVDFSDLDPMSIMFTPNYLKFFIDHMFHVLAALETGYKNHASLTFGVSIASTAIVFHKPMHQGDDFEIRARIIRLGTESITVHLQMGNADRGIVSECEIVLVCVNKGTLESMPWPEQFKNQLLSAAPHGPFEKWQKNEKHPKSDRSTQGNVKEFVTRSSVRYSHLDPLNHTMFTPIYVKFFINHLFKAFAALGADYTSYASMPFAIAMAQLEALFYSPMKPNDDFEIRSKVVRFGTKSLTVHLQMFSADKIVAESELVLVCMDKNDLVSVPWPKRFAEFFRPCCR